MKYAILESGGKQYIAREGETIEVDRLPLEIGKPVEFNEVLLFADNGDVAVGTPTLKGAVVSGRVLDHIKAAKIIVFKYVPKQRYRRKQGHRQQYTRIAIEQINSGTPGGKKASEKEATPLVEKAPAAEKAAKATTMEKKAPTAVEAVQPKAKPAPKKAPAKAKPKKTEAGGIKKPAASKAKPAASKAKPAASKKASPAKKSAEETAPKKTATKSTASKPKSASAKPADKPTPKKSSTTKKK